MTGDLASYYEMVYAPQAGPFDGRFRKVESRSTRKGVTVQTRAGYFALLLSDAAPLMPYELPLLAAAAASPRRTPSTTRWPPSAFNNTAAGSTRWSSRS